MKVTVHELRITARAFSVDSLPALVLEVVKALDAEVHSGEHAHDDGDEVGWCLRRSGSVKLVEVAGEVTAEEGRT